MRWLLVDRSDELVPGERVVGRKCFTYSEPFFQDHFPGFPVVPGVLLLESLAQIAGKLIGYTVRHERGDWPFPIFTMADRVKFRRFVKPGEVVTLEATIVSLRDESCQVKVRAKVGKTVHVQAEQTFVFNAVPLDDAEDAERLEAIEQKALRLLWADCPS